MSNTQREETLYVLLDPKQNKRAIDVWNEVSKEETSSDPVVRAVVDKNAGFISLMTTRPADEIQERTFKITAQDTVEAYAILVCTPGVVRIAETPNSLTKPFYPTLGR